MQLTDIWLMINMLSDAYPDSPQLLFIKQASNITL